MYHSNSSLLVINKPTECYRFFDPIVHGNYVDTANDCQLMSHSHGEKGIKRNMNVNLIFNKTPHLLLLHPKRNKAC